LSELVGLQRAPPDLSQFLMGKKKEVGREGKSKKWPPRDPTALYGQGARVGTGAQTALWESFLYHERGGSYKTENEGRVTGGERRN